MCPVIGHRRTHAAAAQKPVCIRLLDLRHGTRPSPAKPGRTPAHLLPLCPPARGGVAIKTENYKYRRGCMSVGRSASKSRSRGQHYRAAVARKLVTTAQDLRPPTGRQAGRRAGDDALRGTADYRPWQTSTDRQTTDRRPWTAGAAVVLAAVCRGGRAGLCGRANVGTVASPC